MTRPAHAAHHSRLERMSYLLSSMQVVCHDGSCYCVGCQGSMWWPVGPALPQGTAGGCAACARVCCLCVQVHLPVTPAGSGRLFSACAVLLHAAGAYAKAIQLYDQALSHAPGDARLYNNRAIAKLYLKQ